MQSNESMPARAAPAESKEAPAARSLADQARAFFANGRGIVSPNSAPRPTRPGTIRAPLVSSGHLPQASAASSLFAASSGDEARRHAEALAVEADLFDDELFESDAPGM